MATITFKGNSIQTAGTLPSKGSAAPDFTLVASDLSEKTLANYKGKRVILNIFPSIDTGTCAASVRTFNKEAADLNNTVVLCISKDLPFAQSRFCAAEGIENVEVLSEFRDTNFSDAYGVAFTEGPLKGLMSRAVVVLNEQGEVVHAEQVAETTEEPNYQAAIQSLS
jgi:thiol peroxidase